jgi:probable addiction module antidote protein
MTSSAQKTLLKEPQTTPRGKPAKGGDPRLEVSPLDLTPFFQEKEAQVMLLADAIESGHAGYLANALGTIARARGMARVAKAAGVTREALYKSLSEDGDPRLSTLLGVVKALEMKLVFTDARSEV